MKVKVFEVVELNNGDKATILAETEKGYKVEVVDKYGLSKGNKEIEEKDIKKKIFAK